MICDICNEKIRPAAYVPGGMLIWRRFADGITRCLMVVMCQKCLDKHRNPRDTGDASTDGNTDQSTERQGKGQGRGWLNGIREKLVGS